MTEPVKVCTGCGKTKPLSEFGKRKGVRDGRKSRCKECRKASARGYQARNREKYNAYQRGYNARHKETIADRKLMRTFGITLADYDEMLEAQDGGCAICGTTPEEHGKRLCVDHDHETGKNRGLLCDGCNVGLGRFRDSPAWLRNAADYLEAYNESH